MSHSFAELLGYHDCGLQAILYLIENTDVDIDSPVVVEIVKLLISKVTRTAAAAAEQCSSGRDGLASGGGHAPVVHPSPTVPQTTTYLEELCCLNANHDEDPSCSQGFTRLLWGDGSAKKCDEDARTSEETSPNRTTTCDQDDDDDDDDDDSSREFERWLMRLASRRPEIARTLCEVAELIDQKDEH